MAFTDGLLGGTLQDGAPKIANSMVDITIVNGGYNGL